jgi:hypothetical protein
MPRIRLKLEVFPKALGRLKSLEPVFAELKRVHENYITAELANDSDDILYGHRERPHIGLLAAAAWLSGHTSLEEYRCKKGTKRKSSTGRSDLYIRMGKTTFECEAKYATANLGAGIRKSVSEIYDELDDATNDATKHVEAKEEGHRLLGLCFVTPMIAKSEKPLRDTRLGELIMRLKRAIGSRCDALICIRMPEGKAWLEDKQW